MIPIETTLATQSARYLAFLTVFDTPATPKTPEHARNAELARILAFDPERLAEIITLSMTLLTERDLYAGCQPGVAYDVDSLANHFNTDRTTMLSACKLCGALPFTRNERTIWADDETVNCTFDSDAIERDHAATLVRAVA